MIKVTDPARREVNITYYYMGDCPNGGGHCEEIRYKGTGGQERLIRVRRWGTQSHLDPDYQPASIQQLWHEWSDEWDFPIGMDPIQHNPVMPFMVELPNNQSYGLYYNSYGELATVVLPTGGKIKYLWEGGLTPISVNLTVASDSILGYSGKRWPQN